MPDILNHHPIFAKFQFRDHPQLDDFRVNGLGVKERCSFYDEETFTVWKDRCNTFPVLDEEYLEWIDILEAVNGAVGCFTMIELGAGYGPWIVNAVAALRQKGRLPFKLVAVEADKAHFEYLKRHLLDNDIDPDQQDLHNVAVSGDGGFVTFEGGDPTGWYGQSINRNDVSKKDLIRGKLASIIPSLNKSAPDRHNYVTVKAITLASILDKLTLVDLIDMDIQGEEALVVESSIEEMSAKVKRVHIGTHGHEIEDRVRTAFLAHNWQPINDYRCQAEQETPYGTISFLDGVQTWVNPTVI
jgi:FkbM family methyltransferase